MVSYISQYSLLTMILILGLGLVTEVSFSCGRDQACNRIKG